ncbi:HEPN domain-containing protein [Opitutales bacterium]|nr:HEPN domain-containing protein [Opitutales bacterium]
MPSTSLQNFEKHLIKDVSRLINSHSYLNHKGGGRRSLGHITRGGVVMLCAAWERYIEDVLLDSARYLSVNLDSPKTLPKDVQKTIAKEIKKDDHELRCLDLAGDGWKDFYLEKIEEETDRINTPKSSVVDDLFKRFVGLPDLSTNWTAGANKIDDFVKARGEIAHTGSEATYIRIGNLTDYQDIVIQTVVETDLYLANHLQPLSTNGKTPWRRRTRID